MFSIKRTPAKKMSVKKSPAKKMSVKKSPAKKMSPVKPAPKKTLSTLEKALIASILGASVLGAGAGAYNKRDKIKTAVKGFKVPEYLKSAATKKKEAEAKESRAKSQFLTSNF